MPLPSWLAAAPAATFLYSPLAVLAAVAGRVRDPGTLPRWLPAVPLLAGLALAVSLAVLVTVFAYPVVLGITFPLHHAARIILGGRFFERLEGVWLFLWVCATVALLGGLVHGAAAAVAGAFRIPRHTSALPSLAVVVLAISLFPANQADTVFTHQRLAPLAAGLALGVPGAVAALALVRGRRARAGRAGAHAAGGLTGPRGWHRGR